MSIVYKINDGKRIYAIGDIHGHADVLARMHDLIEADRKERPVDEAQIVYVGDYIDRGPDSKRVLDLLIERELFAPEYKHVFLMGNHENGMIEFMIDPHGIRQDWLMWGGIEALESYGVTVERHKAIGPQAEAMALALAENMPLTHTEFLKHLRLSYMVDDYLFAHAGIRPGVPLEKQTKQDLIFIREPFLSYAGHFSHRVVHGHTIIRSHEVDIRSNRINLDTGLYAGGPLTCAAIEDSEVRILQVGQT